jgi:hypothetical protein
MLGGRIHDLLRDEFGGGTVWGLTWFALLVGITGVAVDTTNGLRNQTMLQATADAAALAGAIDLPVAADASASALDLATGNMSEAQYGEVLKPVDVQLGAWDAANRVFTEGGVAPDKTGALSPDSVRVVLHQTDENANAVPVNFLRIIGLQTWNVNVEAIAQRFIPDCLTDGLVAAGLVDISSNNQFTNDLCIHGQSGVAMQNHNIHELGVTVSMPDIDSQLNTPAGRLSGNPGLSEALREQSLSPRMVNHMDEIIGDLLTMEPYVTPSFIDPNNPVIVVDKNFNFANMLAGHVYHVVCSSNQLVGIPNNAELSEVAIVSDCRISIGANAFLHDVVLASRAGGNNGGDSNNAGGGGNSGHGGSGTQNANISGSAGVILGTADNCVIGGGVQIFSNASVSFSSNTTYNGVQIVALGDVDLGAADMGINGINVQAGGNITLTSNNAFGICSNGAPNLQTVDYYRLVL